MLQTVARARARTFGYFLSFLYGMFLLSTDIDGTIYDGPDSAAAFSAFWQDLGSRLTPAPVLVYNTGRSLDDTRALVQRAGLPEPDWYICGVGTTIFHRQRGAPLEEWNRHLQDGWDFSTVHGIAGRRQHVRAQPENCQGPFKSSWFWENADPLGIANLEREIRDSGIDAQAVYSSQRDLDLLPARANKGKAVAFLANELGLSLTQVIVAGDSGNDAAMYLPEGVLGIVVSNAEAALVNALPLSAASSIYRASQACALGVIEGIEHHRARHFPASPST